MIKAINNISSTSFKGNEVKKEEKAQKTPEQIKDGKKKLAIGLAAAATVAIASVAIVAKVKNRKAVDDKTVQNLTEKAQEVVSGVTQEATQKATQAAQNFKFADIKFDKGIASINGEKFTGTISDTLTGGDKITLTYKDGKIMQSVREGSKNVTKKFEYDYCYAPYSPGVGTKITTLNSEGKVIGETELGFSKDGKLNFKTFPDGTEKWWHENGQLGSETFPDGTKKWWYENGQLQLETFPDKTEKWWYENGQLKYETFSDGTVKEWHKNGQLKYETFSDGTVKFWHANGQLQLEKFPDGASKWWYKNGQLKYERFPDGTIKRFDINGQEIK